MLILKYKDKIKEIVEFVVSHPETVASRTIMRRNFVSKYYYETGEELGIQLKDVLKQLNNEEIEVYFDLVR